MSLPRRTRALSSRVSLNLLIYCLIVLAVGLSGLAAWQRYAHMPMSAVGDTVEQRIDGLMPNLGLIESWTQAGGMRSAPNCEFVCPQCQSSVLTRARGVNLLCPFCSVKMDRLGINQQVLGRQGARVALVAGTGTGTPIHTWPIPIQANAVRPHPDRGACTNCHTVVKVGAASPVQVAAGAGPARLWRGVAAPAIKAGAVKPTLIRQFGIEVIAVPGGAKVTGVMGNSFADRAGAKAGDIIISCNGARVRDVIRFKKAVVALIPESNAKIKVLRNGTTKDLSIMVGEGEMEAFLPIKRP